MGFGRANIPVGEHGNRVILPRVMSLYGEKEQRNPTPSSVSRKDQDLIKSLGSKSLFLSVRDILSSDLLVGYTSYYGCHIKML
jgi:hypothetical protein